MSAIRREGSGPLLYTHGEDDQDKPLRKKKKKSCGTVWYSMMLKKKIKERLESIYPWLGCFSSLTVYFLNCVCKGQDSERQWGLVPFSMLHFAAWDFSRMNLYPFDNYIKRKKKWES